MENKLNSNERIIVALDVFRLEEADQLVSELKECVGGFKAGLQLITSCGSNEVISMLNKHNVKIFYDAKFNDIPSTIGKATKALATHGIWMFNIHASAGEVAIKEAFRNKGKSKLISVTILTSLSDQMSVKLFGNSALIKSIEFASMAAQNGCEGVVCSPLEIRALKETTQTSKLLLVVPGIRPLWADADDQSRYLEPSKAVALGADYLVIGRPITKPPPKIGNSKNAVDKICSEIESLPKQY